MKIVHLSTVKNHPCFSDVVFQQTQEHDVVFIVLVPVDTGAYKVPEKYAENGVSYIHLTVPQDVDFKDDTRLEAVLNKLLMILRPDVVHVQMFSGVNLRAVFKATEPLTPRKVLTLHTHGLFCLPGICFDQGKVCQLARLSDCTCESCHIAADAAGTSLGMYNRMREQRIREILGLIDVVICPSRWQRNTIQRLIGPEDRSLVMYYGYNTYDELEDYFTMTRAGVESAGVPWDAFKEKVVSNGWSRSVGEDEMHIQYIPDNRREEIKAATGLDDKTLTAIIGQIIPNVKIAEKETVMPTFGYLGTLWELKGVRTLLDAVSELEGFEFQIFMGIIPQAKDAQEEELLERINACDQMVVMPNLDRNELNSRFFSQLDYLIIPSIWEETGPMTLFEAMFFRVPMIIADRPSMTEKVIEGVNAHIFRDAKQLAGIMRDVIAKKISAPERSYLNFPVSTYKQYTSQLIKVYSADLQELRESHGSAAGG